MDIFEEWINLLSDFFLSILALWQGLKIISEEKIEKTGALDKDSMDFITKAWISFWVKARRYEGVVFIFVFTGFLVTIILRFIHIY